MLANNKFKPKAIPFGFWGIGDDVPFLHQIVEWFESEYERTPTIRELALCMWYTYYRIRVLPFMLNASSNSKISIYFFFMHKYGLTPEEVDKLPVDLVIYALETEKKMSASIGGSSYNEVRGAPIG
jgi:hypothetical protein